MAPFADAIYAMDRKWWNEYGWKIESDAELWTTNPTAAHLYKLNLIPSKSGGGMSTEAGKITQGGNSGYQAVTLAIHFGASRVILLGYDMQAGIKLHWHKDHGSNLGNPVPARMKRWREWFAELAKQSPSEIVNVSRETALTCFPRMSLRDCLA